MLNRPTPRGRELGRYLAKLADKAEGNSSKRFPDQVKRCSSCAFRGGTIPNGCEETLMDAIKCVMEGYAFYCHETKGDDKPLCAGWVQSQGELIGKPKIPTPWPFTHDKDAWEALDAATPEHIEAHEKGN